MTQDYHQQFAQRKRDHITHALDARNEASGGAGLDAVTLLHQALPECDFADVTLASQRFGQAEKTPFLISSMTAGHQAAININLHLALACQETGWAMGVGSQRRQLTDPEAVQEWHIIRAQAPQATLYGNIGLAQLRELSAAQCQALVDSIAAKALFVHLNPLQECLQPEGTPQFTAGLDAIKRCVDTLSVPVIVKETGCGIGPATFNMLNNTGIAAVDISGFGGTHWGRIEGARAQGYPQLARAAHTFKDWGIPTVKSLQYGLQAKPDYELWASGGVRNGLDAAKLLALGATTIGLAKPMLEAAMNSPEAVIDVMQTIELECKIALFCTGQRSIADLQTANVVEWL